MITAVNAVLIGLFLLLPYVVVGVRLFRRPVLPWWVAFGGVVLAGWALVLAIAMLNETPDGGAPKVFALFFGWAHTLLWSTPAFLAHGVVRWFQGRSRRAADAGGCP